MALKYSRSPEILKVLPVIIRMLNSLGERDDDYLKVVLLYIGSLVDERRISEFLRIVRVEHIDGVSYMKTIADALAEKGRKEEREKSQKKEIALREEAQQKETALREVAKKKVVALQEETVKRMLQKNMNIELIHDITGLSIERIEVIQKKIGL